MKALKGICYFHCEQGYEGRPWAFQDSAFIYEPTEDFPHEQWSFEGLHFLEDGDVLTIYAPTSDEVLWSGTMEFVNDEPTGMPLEKWIEYFGREYPGELTPCEKREGEEDE